MILALLVLGLLVCFSSILAPIVAQFVFIAAYLYGGVWLFRKITSRKSTRSTNG